MRFGIPEISICADKREDISELLYYKVPRERIRAGAGELGKHYSKEVAKHLVNHAKGLTSSNCISRGSEAVIYYFFSESPFKIKPNANMPIPQFLALLSDELNPSNASNVPPNVKRFPN